MKEIIRLHNASCNTGMGRVLSGYSLAVFAGEIVCVMGISGSGKSALEKTLTGETALSGGLLYVHGEECPAHSPANAFSKGIYSIGMRNSMAANLSVADNLEAIRPVKNPFRVYHRKKAYLAAAETLREYQISGTPDRQVDSLSFLEGQILSVAKAVKSGARLVIINCVHDVYNAREAVELGRQICRLKSAGVSFLVISERPNPLFDIADRVQIIHKGSDLYQWEGGIFNRSRYNSRWGQAARRREKASCGNKVKALCLLDIDWNSRATIHSCLKTLRENNKRIWNEYLAFSLPERDSFYDGKTAIVPCDSAGRLLKNMSVEDNLIICIPGRAGKTKLRIIHSGMKRLLLREFHALLGLDAQVTRVSQLTEVQKKILSIYRLELDKPDTIVLESPFWGMDEREIGQLTGYLADLGQKRVKLLIYSKDWEDIEDFCGPVIITRAGKNARIV
ncbi:MAG: ATP-binding cassette domain-containing protein [Oscillospiraceae bacterium]|jgi:ABC-type sugar transport system ATPase subunit|nr:ATP-binding cassette domain-containing protein [Oscillospiraceae bacterium]